MRRLGLDLNQDGQIDTADVKQLTRAQAADIFEEHYFYRPRIDALPEPVQASVYDMYVNAGSNAVKILQGLLLDMGYDVVRDGAIGPQTIRASFAAFDEAQTYFADAYAIARRDYYYAVADRRPASRKFARRRDGGKGGWIKRAEKFMQPMYHLSQTAHRERTASWG